MCIQLSQYIVSLIPEDLKVDLNLKDLEDGLSIIICELTIWIILLLYGLFYHHLFQVFLYMFTCIVLRSKTESFHQDTPEKCIITSLLLFFIIMLVEVIVPLHYSLFILLIICINSIGLLQSFSKKQMIHTLKKLSRTLVLLMLIFLNPFVDAAFIISSVTVISLTLK